VEPGIVLNAEVGAIWFEIRAELAVAVVHRHRQAGISGSSSQGADSIVLSDGYEDDEDYGDVVDYTGYGGRDRTMGRQVSDQSFTLWNRALAFSGLNGLPVRIIRGAGHDSPYSPGTGYSCQMCSTRLEGIAGPYAEAAHIRPLGAPHNGPDTLDTFSAYAPTITCFSTMAA